MHKHLTFLLLAFTLAACTPPYAAKTTDLCTYLPLDGATTRIRNESTRQHYERAADAVSGITAHGDDSKRKYCGQIFHSMADDATLHANISTTLGAAWQPRETRTIDGFTIALWQSRSNFWPRQHYALISPPATAHGEPRLLRSLYITNSDSGLNGSVVFGTILITLTIVPIALVVPFWRKRRRKHNNPQT